MSDREKGRQWDGRSRIPDDTYRKNWEDIFGKREQPKEEEEKNKKDD
jgi:hypothetical protein